jgi:hypothetical protein
VAHVTRALAAGGLRNLSSADDPQIDTADGRAIRTRRPAPGNLFGLVTEADMLAKLPGMVQDLLEKDFANP